MPSGTRVIAAQPSSAQFVFSNLSVGRLDAEDSVQLRLGRKHFGALVVQVGAHVRRLAGHVRRLPTTHARTQASARTRVSDQANLAALHCSAYARPGPAAIALRCVADLVEARRHAARSLIEAAAHHHVCSHQSAIHAVRSRGRMHMRAQMVGALCCAVVLCWRGVACGPLVSSW